MIKLRNLLKPSNFLCEEVEEKELPEQFEIFERGLNYLRDRIAVLNKKAAKYKVPSLDIEILGEKMVKVLRPEIEQQVKSGAMKIDPALYAEPYNPSKHEGLFTLAKKFVVRIEGEPPHIEGYEFIARLEHTPEGNFVYTNPKSSVPNLPAEYKSMNQHCDICKTNRDRNDTFVIKMEKDDPLRFPDKKAGDLIVVGRNCLARFMPGGSINSIVWYTKMIDNLQDDIKAAGKMNDYEGGSGGGGKYYEDSEHLLRYIVATYLHTGKYVSKKAAQISYDKAQMGEGKPVESTLHDALHNMRPYPVQGDPHHIFPVYYKLKDDPEFVKKVEAMMEEFNAWIPTVDFTKMAMAKPDFATYIQNLELVSKLDYIRGTQFRFFSGLFQVFLREKQDKEKKADAAASLAALPPSPVKFDETLVKKKLRDVAKEMEIKRLIGLGTDEKAIKKIIRGKAWGWEATVKKITPYTPSYQGYGATGEAYRIFFRDDYGNDFLWFASNNPGFEEGGKYLIDGTITRFEPLNKYSGRSQTLINRVKIVKDFQHPDLPPQPEVPEAPAAGTPATPEAPQTPPPTPITPPLSQGT